MKLTTPFLDHLGLGPLRILASSGKPLPDHALELSLPKPFAQMDTNGERVSEEEEGFALVRLVFEVVDIHSVGGSVV